MPPRFFPFCPPSTEGKGGQKERSLYILPHDRAPRSSPHYQPNTQSNMPFAKAFYMLLKSWKSEPSRDNDSRGKTLLLNGGIVRVRI